MVKAWPRLIKMELTVLNLAIDFSLVFTVTKVKLSKIHYVLTHFLFL